MRHIFVLGLDDFHLQHIKQIHHAQEYEFHGLLDFEEVIKPAEYPIADLIEKAIRQIDEFPHEVAAVITHWDFPASTIMPIICERFGLRSASLESVLKCEHKYWSRLEQQAVIGDMTPRFGAINPFDEEPLKGLDLDYPFWVKPIKGFSSHLGFRIENAQQFNQVLPKIRRRIGRIGNAFNVVLDRIQRPEKVAEVDGNWLIAEQIVQGKQCGIEGFVQNGRVRIHGVFDGVKDSHNLSFTRWEYPSAWPEHVQQRMFAAAEKLMSHVGFDNSPFGIEFFWDEKADRLSVLEVNTRISQSHSDQFIKVKGFSNHEAAVDVALGRKPEVFQDESPYRVAAKFILRRYADARVERVPAPQEVRELEQTVPDSTIQITAEQGKQLDEMHDQDSYSYEIANLWLGAMNQEELLEKYHALADQLKFEFSDGKQPEEFQFKPVSY